MAEAMAGESGKPFVNIDASMLNTMGMGVLKVKLLFRKLRKYALKYDGVVAFFDEADAIGNRGQLAGSAATGYGIDRRRLRARTDLRWTRLPVGRAAELSARSLDDRPAETGVEQGPAETGS